MTKNVGNILSKWDINNSIITLFDFIFPRKCLTCKVNLSTYEKVICTNCLSTFKKVPNEIIHQEYMKKFKDNMLIDDFHSAFIFEKDKPIQNLLHSYKYENKIYVGKFLGELIFNELNIKLFEWDADYIIPVPLHTFKKLQRGYNQSYYIAKAISKKLNIPLKPNLLKRKRFTQTQTKMNFIERKENVRNAFQVKHDNKIIDKKIILIDDVITTGATVSECAKTLKEKNAKKVFALSFAIPFDYIFSGAETPNIDKPFLNTI